MLVLVLVVKNALFLHAFLQRGDVDARDARGIRWRGQRGDLQAVERAAGVAFRGGDEMLPRLGRELDLQVAQPALGIGQRGVDELRELGRAQRLELKNLRARDERAVDVERGIVRRRADQPHRAGLDIGQEDVLLRFVEAMNLVDEKDGALAGRLHARHGGGQHAAHIGHRALDAIQPLKVGRGPPRDHLRQ